MIYITAFMPDGDAIVIRLPSVPRVGEIVQRKGQQLRVSKVRYLPENDLDEQVDIWLELP